MSGTEDPGHGVNPPPPDPNPYVGQQYQPYGQPYQPGQIPFGPPPDHPEAAKVLVFGILGMAVCQVLSPFAMVTGARVRREIEASAGRLGGRQTATFGWVLGLVGTIVLGLGLLIGVVYLGIVVSLVIGAAG